MSRSFTVAVPYASPPAVVHQALTDERLWQSRFAEAPNAKLETSSPDGPGTLSITMSEQIGPNALPGLVKKVVRGDLGLTRTDVWGPLENDVAHGTFSGESTGITGAFAGTITLRAAQEGSVVEFAGKFDVKVRLVGGAIEAFAEQAYSKLLRSERKYAEKWIAEQKLD